MALVEDKDLTITSQAAYLLPTNGDWQFLPIRWLIQTGYRLLITDTRDPAV